MDFPVQDNLDVDIEEIDIDDLEDVGAPILPQVQTPNKSKDLLKSEKSDGQNKGLLEFKRKNNLLWWAMLALPQDLGFILLLNFFLFTNLISYTAK